MQDATVTCGCTRKMALDPIRGRGAYRCGCGARVTVTINAATSCVALASQGARCTYTPMRESAEHGVPLCKEHLKTYRTYLDTIEEQDRREHQFLHGHRLDPRYSENTSVAKRSLRLDLARERGSMVVYYIRIGNNIKIGTTTNLKMRMIALQPDEILATEPGHEELERARHKQFAHLRVPPGRERFSADPELMSHIQMLNDHFGPPTEAYPPLGDSAPDLL